MSDSTSPMIFGKMFKLLAVNPTLERKLIATELWKGMGQYDFHPVDMDAADACIKLGLAKYAIDPDYPEDEADIIFND